MLQDDIHLLKALADTTRLRILRLLTAEELSVHELVKILQAPQPSVSRHLAILRNAELVVDRRAGARVYYSVSEKLTGHDVFGRYLAEMAQGGHGDAQRLEQCLIERSAAIESFADEKADQWDELARGLQQLPAEMLMIAGLAPAGQVVADLGTGTGLLLPFLSTFAGRVFAVDQSSAMLRRARARAERAQLKNVEFVKARLEQLDGQIPECDALTLHFVLHQTSSPQLVLENVAEVMKPGARLVLVDRLPHNDESAAEKYGSIWFGFDHEQILNWSKNAGLTEKLWFQLPENSEVDVASTAFPLFVAIFNKP